MSISLIETIQSGIIPLVPQNLSCAKITTLKTWNYIMTILFERKDIDVYEHEKLSNFKVKEQDFYCSTFHSHCMAFNNEIYSYDKISVKRP
jgi:hypothetical protein